MLTSSRGVGYSCALAYARDRDDAASELTQTNTTIAVGTPGLGGMSLGGPDFFGADGLATATYAIPDDGAR